MHVLWETDRWLQKFCVSNSANLSEDLDPSKENVSTDPADSEVKAVAASGGGGGGVEASDFDLEGCHVMPRSLLW